MPKCKAGLVVAIVATGMFAATAVAATIDGNAGPNRLIGTNEADVIDALGGDDRVWARAGDDQVLGGFGDDALRGGAGNDQINGQPGSDRIWGHAGDDQLQGWAGADRIWGGLGNDTLVGDVPEAGDIVSPDHLWGGPGADTLRGGDGRDVMRGGPDDDTADGGAGDDLILANRGRDMLEGGAGDDQLFALIKDDVSGPGDLEGDTVNGADGNDRIRVRDGEQDVVRCGPGFDVARLDALDVTPDNDCERVLRRDPRPGDDREERRQGVPTPIRGYRT